MPIYLLNNDLVFPSPTKANDDGLLAIGGDLAPERLLMAYEMGIFPWFNPDDPVLWWSPDPRCVLFLDQLRVSKSMRNVLNQKQYTVSVDQQFSKVLDGCSTAPRKENGTWISDEIKQAYLEVHALGMAHSVEVWKENELVGGLYGVSLGNAFFGESMFSMESNASKIGLVYFARALQSWGMEWMDCQIMNPHLKSLGAVEIPRREFLNNLEAALKLKTKKGSWTTILPINSEP
jgi:leucyl/phenylalanyl-tRNA---protein transferase